MRFMVLVSVLGVLAAISAVEAAAQARIVQPGAPGSPSTQLTLADMAVPERPRHTEADVRFMQNMMHHHAQAVVMSRLAHERTERPVILLLAERIERAQADEIALMTRWLELRGEAVPELELGADDRIGHGHQAHGAHHAQQHEMEHGADGHGMMAGMLTSEQLDELAAARDDEFDRLLLAFMIHHHEGALEMVSELFASPGALQDSAIFQFAAHVEADQDMEIRQMGQILARID